jgi:acetyl-CoA synthetase
MANHDSILTSWQAITANGALLSQSVDERLTLHQKTFADWDEANHGPAPIWIPSEIDVSNSNLQKLINQLEADTLESLHSFWQSHPNRFWTEVVSSLGIQFSKPARSVLTYSDPREPNWLTGAKLNIVENCFQAAPESIAIRYGGDDGNLNELTYGELLIDVQLLAAQLRDTGFEPGDPLAIAMPMTARSVVIYLAILYAGCTAVSIADSFAAAEIAKRLRISKAKAIFFAETFPRSGKTIQLGSTIRQAVAICERDKQDIQLLPIKYEFGNMNPLRQPHYANPEDTINVLFSSGTTGDPKAIPWDHTTPIKCAADGKYHHNIKPDDVVTWPTNLGWMMGPWLIFATLINRATIGLFENAPTGEDFGQFVQDSTTTMLGVVPALVRHWKRTKCMERFDWSSIRCFSSTGEASNSVDMTYLSSLAGFRPIIEYCGGTEIGGGYVSSTVIQHNVPAAFSCPGIGSQFVILDDDGTPTDEGELYLVSPTMGLSRNLLNRDHFETYYADVPKSNLDLALRRHGDRMQQLPNGYWRACGRTDDTMNPGGIKIGSAEIETVVNQLDGIQESAVIAAPQPGGGPDELIAFIVTPRKIDVEATRDKINRSIRDTINPLIRIAKIMVVASLPRTASNKIMRRQLRSTLELADD